MTIDELIKELENIRDQNNMLVECCTYDWVLNDYTNRLCLETVDGDYYIDNDTDQPVHGKRILLL